MSKKKQSQTNETAVESAASEAQNEVQNASETEIAHTALHPTNPENEIVDIGPDLTSLNQTGEVAIDMPFEDNQVLSRLRSTVLTASEVYREAQLFSAQNLDIASLLRSNEPVLVQNTAEILRALDIYHPAAVPALLMDDDKTREIVSRYLLHCLRMERVEPTALTDILTDIDTSDDSHRKISAFADKLCTALFNMLVQNQSDPVSIQTSLTRLCSLLDASAVSRLLYDPSPLVRVAVIRSFMNRAAIGVNDLSIALILLKDNDESVNTALMRMFARFATCPELVIPQLLATNIKASANLKKEISDVYRSYGNDVVDPIIQSLGSIQPGIYESACEAIALCPPRFTDALLKTLTSVRTSALVKERTIDILKNHKDISRREEIYTKLKPYLGLAEEEKPVWTPPETAEKFLKPATDDAIFYETLLSDAEIASFAKSYDSEKLARLLNDASTTVQINAMHVIKHQQKVSPANMQIIQVWLKSSSPDLAAAALDTVLTLEKDPDAAARIVIEAFAHNESDEVKRHYFDVMTAHQDSINALIRAFYEKPQRCAGFILKFLAMGPNEETLKHILAGLERNQSVACIAETMKCLLTIKCDFDNKKIRSLIMSHVREPISFGQHGFMTRLFGLKLLRKFMTEDETSDKATVSELQAFYKDGKNAELKHMTKDLLKDLGEEIFDFDDEDDDFEDLNDDEDDL